MKNNFGSQCFHGKLQANELIYNRLLDDENMMVITDQTAGIDSVGTSMFCASEINLFVVEPTMKSIGIIKDFENVTKNYNLKNYVVINKALDESDVEFVKRELGEEKVIGVISYSSNIRRYEQGDKEKFNLFIEENKEVFEKIQRKIGKNIRKDFMIYTRKIVKHGIQNIMELTYFGYINNEFDYEKAIKENNK